VFFHVHGTNITLVINVLHVFITNEFHRNGQAGYKAPGCFDLKCVGFVPVKYAPINPGDTLEGKSKISIKIFKVGCQHS
jgi:hypothetical protein